jgi:SAM-dependent methyltransferase
MKGTNGIGLPDVQAVYNGCEGVLWELLMGEQIHIGGFKSSIDLADKAGIGKGMKGIDLCCCSGAGMRFLIRCKNVEKMTGVDATSTVVVKGYQRCEEEGLAGKIEFVLADACESGLPSESADFIWSEDAWCYVSDKAKLISEAVRMLKPGGVAAFTDWVEGPTELSETEAERLLKFMKFPNIQDIDGYKTLLRANDCNVEHAEDTGRFPEYVDLYLKMLDMQLTYDALKIIGFDIPLLGAMGEEMAFMQKLAHEKKIIQGLFVARKPR